MSRQELLAQVLQLSREDRALVAEELLVSLEEDDSAVAASWSAELQRRSDELARGEVQAVEWSTAKAEILTELEQRRARRATS